MSSGGSIWIKGRFDGDYETITNTARHIGPDVERQKIIITRGRMTHVQRLSSAPDLPADSTLRQRVVELVHVSDPPGPGWKVQVHDLHVTDWHSQSTSTAVGGKEFGRIVGWGYAKILPPRPEDTLEAELPPEEALTNDKGWVGRLNDTEPATPLRNEPEGHMPPAPEPPPPQDLPTAPVPCAACGWIWPLILGVLCLWLCSWQWALLAVTPFLLRCLVSQIDMPPRKLWLERLFSVSWFIVGLIGFAYWVRDLDSDCSSWTHLPMVVLAMALIAAARMVHCWVGFVLALLWTITALLSCPSSDWRCSAQSGQLIDRVEDKLDRIKTDLDQRLRPDRDSHDVAQHTSDDYPWQPVTLESVENDPQLIFDCRRREGARPPVITLGESVLFDLGSSNFSPGAQASLARLGKLLREHPNTMVLIVGHSDRSAHPDGPTGNLRLSELRALSVAEWLISNGFITPDRIAPLGVGDRFPTMDTTGEFRKNRRVEVRVSCKPGQ